jgi:hypothetical protein
MGQITLIGTKPSSFQNPDAARICLTERIENLEDQADLR